MFLRRVTLLRNATRWVCDDEDDFGRNCGIHPRGNRIRSERLAEKAPRSTQVQSYKSSGREVVPGLSAQACTMKSDRVVV
jgi:hypothetical protein